MFTGIVSAVGRVEESMPQPQGVRLTIHAGSLDLSDIRLGDSVAVNGVCLTVIACAPPRFEVDVSAATLAVTCGLQAGDPVNLEKALRLSDRLGGHLVSGHVDGVGFVQGFEARGESWFLRIRAPGDLPRFIARKGSITVNGVSLTVNEVSEDCFEINIIPHTRAVTTFAGMKPGDAVNLEVDLLARYADRARQWPEA